MCKPDPRIAAYVAEVSRPGVPYLSTSHLTMGRLYQEHGRCVIDQLLKEYWESLRAT